MLETRQEHRRSALGAAVLGLAVPACEWVRSEETPKVATLETTAPSCQALPKSCGPQESEDCCKRHLVRGGTFSRDYDAVDYLNPEFRATVSNFYLDRFETTVGRFRAFVDAGSGTQKKPPEAGAGAHPKIPGSGWNSSWNVKLPEDLDALHAAMNCFGEASWTAGAGDNERKPINCLDWFSAFAFCAWEGGRLPTETEWTYAASGGEEQRYFPWSVPPNSTKIDKSLAVYCADEGACGLAVVGSKSPAGDGRFGHADLGGNAWEWMLDRDTVPYPSPCTDCAALEGGRYRAFRSGSHDDLAPTLRASTRHVYYPEHRGNIGVRCASD